MLFRSKEELAMPRKRAFNRRETRLDEIAVPAEELGDGGGEAEVDWDAERCAVDDEVLAVPERAVVVLPLSVAVRDGKVESRGVVVVPPAQARVPPDFEESHKVVDAALDFDALLPADESRR